MRERTREREREREGERVGSAGEQLWRLSNRKSVTACDSVSMHTTQKYIRNGGRVDERSDSMHHPSFFFTRNPPLVCLPHPSTFNKTNLPCFHSDHAGFFFIDMWWRGAMDILSFSPGFDIWEGVKMMVLGIISPPLLLFNDPPKLKI